MKKTYIQRITMPTTFSDVHINTMMDHAFRGEYLLTPMLHSHPYYEVICTIDGTFNIGFTDGTSFAMPKESICILPPNLYHRTYSDSTTNGTTVRKLAIQFDYRQVENTHSSIYNKFHGVISGIIKPQYHVSPELCQLMKRIRDEMHSAYIGTDVMCELLLSELYIILIRILSSANGQSQNQIDVHDDLNRRYLQIDHYLAQHWTDSITADDIAAELNLSRRQLDRVFMEIYGMSFKAKLIEMRMSLAVNLLENTDIPIEEIAVRVGYDTFSGFYMAFKKCYGLSASDYRKMYRNTFKNET